MRDDVGARILELTLTELAIFSFMQTDANPANFYYDSNTSQLHLIDMGACKEYDRQFTRKYLELVKWAAEGGQNQEHALQLSV